MNRAVKYRAYPSSGQAQLFAKTFGCCRKVWNLMLSDKIAYYRAERKTLATTPAQYKADYPFLKEVDSLALANVQLNLQSAYKKFFREKRIGFPKYKSRSRSRRSYTTNNQKGTVAVSDNSIRLPKIGDVRAVIHRRPDPGWTIKSATVSQERDGSYYISVLFEYERQIMPAQISDHDAIGLDYKSDGLYMDSDGNAAGMHKYYRESQAALAKAQRRLSRMTGSAKHSVKSHNYLKQLHKVSRIHRHAANQRLDDLHKRSTEIANRYTVVCVEDLDMKAMANHKGKLGKATMDNGYGIFLNLLAYKLADRGGYLVKVGRWYPSSQLCQCGYRNPITKDRSIRIVYCPKCGAVYDRDYNAAINIRNEGLRILKSAV